MSDPTQWGYQYADGKTYVATAETHARRMAGLAWAEPGEVVLVCRTIGPWTAVTE